MHRRGSKIQTSPPVLFIFFVVIVSSGKNCKRHILIFRASRVTFHHLMSVYELLQRVLLHHERAAP